MRIERCATEALPDWFAGGGQCSTPGILLQDAPLADWESSVSRKDSRRLRVPSDRLLSIRRFVRTSRPAPDAPLETRRSDQ